VAEPLVRALKRFEREGFAPLVAAYSRRDLLLGQAVSTSAARRRLDGIAEGVDEQGALRVRSDGVHRVVSGEVSVRLGSPAGPDAARHLVAGAGAGQCAVLRLGAGLAGAGLARRRARPSREPERLARRCGPNC
jgi:hypothetical protein